MGDHRASIKIQAEFHGVKKQCDMWINYFPSSCEGVDESVVKFFQNLYNEGMAVYERKMEIFEAERGKEERERAERAELARLKAKYEGIA